MLGDRLAKKRKQKKLTQEDVAKKLTIPRSTYSNYELDNREPDVETLLALADLFDCSVDWLTGNSKESFVDDYQDTDDIDKQIMNELKRVSEEDRQYFLGLLKRMPKK